jgi:hypothetical protein
MNPDDRPISEWMQPVRPIRILFKLETRTVGTTSTSSLCVPLASECEYLTIDGIFIQARSKSVMFAETLIDGHWLRPGA